jgi:7-cyano-7-deazaguanine synthase
LKSIALLSGGIDSAAALFWSKSMGRQVYALTFDYEREQSPELRAAKKVARAAGVERHFIVKMGFYKRLNGSPSARRTVIVDPDDGISQAYVPGRNIVFLGVSAAYAETLGAEEVVTGHNLGDADRFPDANPTFFEAFNKLLMLGLKGGSAGRPVKVVVPFEDMSKVRVLAKALELGVPLKDTWSCYNNGSRPCGLCYGCKSRRQAFRELGVSDPLMG